MDMREGARWRGEAGRGRERTKGCMYKFFFKVRIYTRSEAALAARDPFFVTRVNLCVEKI